MERRGNFTQLVCTVLLLGFVASGYGQTRVYVKPAATGTGDGSSWTNAEGDLCYVLEKAAANSEIWVAEGTYIPNRVPLNSGFTDNRTKTFLLKTNVKVYGSFAGTETSLSERTTAVMAAHPSILSGDIGDPDVFDDNAYHVVLSVPTEGANSGVLDGFTISGGNANREGYLDYNGITVLTQMGGGVYFSGDDNSMAAPNLANLIVTGNYGNDGGGMVFFSIKPITITNCVVMENKAGGDGGGIFAGNTGITADKVDILDNEATLGGGMMFILNFAPMIMSHSNIRGNTASSQGGAIFMASTAVELNNVLIAGNNAGEQGGGLYVAADLPFPVLTNVTIADNNKEAVYIESRGGRDHDFTPKFYNSIVYGNELGVVWDNSRDSVTFQYSLVQGIAANPVRHLLDGTSANPRLFVDGPGFSSTPSLIGNYRLKPGAIAVNKGSNYFYTDLQPSPFPGTLPEIDLTGVTKDLDDLDRTVDGVVDLGAYEGETVANLTPALSLSPSIVSGTTNVAMVGEISEFNGKHTNGPITVYVLKDLLFSLSFDPAATSVAGQSVDNSIWSFDSTSNSNYYILTTSLVFAANSVHRFGLMTNVAPGSLNGKSASGIMILPDSGGDINNNDNGDDDIMVYQPE